MPHPSACRVPDEELIFLLRKYGSDETARRTGYTDRNVKKRRRVLERRYNIRIDAPQQKKITPQHRHYEYHEHAAWIRKSVQNGTVLVGGDNHYWPGPPSLMHRAFVHMCKELKPVGLGINGDVNDFGRISKWQRIGWEKLPETAEELEAGKERMGEIEDAAFRAWKVWSLGNHDARFSNYIANHAPEIAQVEGTKLRDHYPLWEPCWELHINDDVVVRHRDRGGKHDAYTSALHAGCTVLVGHSHCPYVRAISDRRGVRYGVNTGCIADPHAPAFLNYTEGKSYKDWRPAFAVLTFRSGRLQPPELVEQWDANSVVFRGEVIQC